MKLIRNEMEGQGVVYGGGGYLLFTPEYLSKCGPPIGDVPVGAWEVSRANWRDFYEHPLRFPSAKNALEYLSGVLHEDVTLETAGEREARQRLGGGKA